MLTVSCSTNSATNPPTENPVDVYVAGQKNGKACYWKNNREVILDNGTMSNSNATKIIVSNGDVYVLGTYAGDITPTIEYVYWKNGVMTNLNQTLSDSVQRVQAITDMDVSGNDVYFIGKTYGTGTVLTKDLAYWKNGIKTAFSTNIYSNDDASIKFYNNNVYFTGIKTISGSRRSGYYINDLFYEDQIFMSSNFTIKDNAVCVYGPTYYPTDLYPSFFKNLETGTVTTLPIPFLNKLVCDGNDNYVSDRVKILKNNETIYNVALPAFDSVKDFEVLNGNTYILTQTGDIGTLDKLLVNNIETLQVNSTGNSTSFNAVIVVQN